MLISSKWLAPEIKRDPREPTDPGYKGELDVLIAIFEHSEEGLQELKEVSSPRLQNPNLLYIR